MCGTYGEKRNTYSFWWGSLIERDKLEGLHVGGRIILKEILKKYEGKRALDSSDSEEVQVIGCCVHGDETSDIVKCREFLE
jgi:hypothetical protein